MKFLTPSGTTFKATLFKFFYCHAIDLFEGLCQVAAVCKIQLVGNFF